LDSDSLLASVALLLSLLLYIGVNLSEGAYRRVMALGNESLYTGEVRRKVSQGRHFATLFSRIRLVSVIAATLSTVALGMSMADAPWATVSGVGVLLAILLGLRFLLPGIGARRSSSVLQVTLPPLAGSARVLRPLLSALDRVASSASSANGIGTSRLDIGDEAGDLSLIQEAEEAGERERRMITAVLRLEEITAREVMVPRVDVVAVEADTPVGAMSELMSEGGKSRIPIYEESLDRVVGIVHARDLLKYLGPWTSPATMTVRDIARPAVFVPESKPLDELLREFQEQRITIAVVVDEYGGVEGLITMEDMVEEIVGEIEDELEREEPSVLQISEGVVVVDARLPLDEVNELFQTDLEGDGFDTLGGLLYARLGKIPASGDELVLDGIRLEVLSTTGRRIRKIRIVWGT
jgi:putative hemolysin